MNINRKRIALNPLQYMATPDGWLDPSLAPPLEEQLAFVAAQGFDHIHCAVPPTLSPNEYKRKLDTAGLLPGPGYLSLLWSDDPSVRSNQLQKCRATAEINAGLGSDLSFLALSMTQDAPRVREHAGVGHKYSARRLEAIIDYIGSAAELAQDAGMTTALHPHVGTWIETEEETRAVLDAIPAGLLKFGPDTGHLTWAGADLDSVLQAYSDRVAGIHIKDLYLKSAETGRRDGLNYTETVKQVLWTEPGTGDADFTRIFSALAPNYDGWTVIEVDKGNRATPEESIALCGDWVRSLS